MALELLPGESDMLAAVVDNLADDVVKLVYADWLEDRDDKRAGFLRDYVAAAKEMWLISFPRAKRTLSEEWLELIGFRLVEQVAIAHAQQPPDKAIKLKKKLLPLARPALRMREDFIGRALPVGASKIGGLPDLPTDFVWPPGGDCQAIYNDDTGGTDRLAGFLCQLNFADIADSQVARVLKLTAAGVLSFFCFQDIENDNPDAVGALAVFFPDPSKLVRTEPPTALTEGNHTIEELRLTFVETLDLPDTSGPWQEVWDAIPEEARDPLVDHLRRLNFNNLFGYARGTSGGDPTPSKQSRHLILLTNQAGCRLHIQIPAKALAARDFGKITLNWVDFD
ncbi:TIGR02996 domain-containing protein [Limnoglobus roseus]|uniref:TIGR02996 domain-containing protein n=1 Tax=Limnoglobus roseus TaxID=2598579 RepID=A0A5C1ACM4_9BACT|nr:DUF1963 domain-containing protein [Limnoglobus roseus]QEL15736.1 TIGR02996 domain-containing protein [Limnoglobus roseus]